MLSDQPVHVRFKLSALWVAVTLLYIYGDLFGFFERKTLLEIVGGTSGAISTQGGLLAAASLMAMPSLMVALSLVLAPRVARWANIVAGVAFTLIVVATMPGAWLFYELLSVIELVLTLAIIRLAWRWPLAASG